MFFIVGHPRSGTTVMAAILSRHPHVAIPPETHFMTRIFDRIWSKDALLSKEKLLSVINKNTRMSDLGLTQNELLACLPDKATLRDAFVFILNSYSNKYGKTVAGEKTPAHLLYIPVLMKWYPDAKFICMTRDPRDVIDSLMNVLWTHKNIRRHALQWRYNYKQALRYVSQYPDRVIIVRLEDVIADPDAKISEVCGYLGLNYASEMTQKGRSEVCPEWEREWKRDAVGVLDKQRIQKWRLTPDNYIYRVVEHMCGREMRRLGYGQEMHALMALLRVKVMFTSLFYPRILDPIIVKLMRIKRLFRVMNRKTYRDRMVDAQKRGTVL